MVDYLTASESLDKLCETNPDAPVAMGILKSGVGLAFNLCTVASGGVMLGFPYHGDALDLILRGTLGVVAVVTAVPGVYLTADGLTSIAKPLALFKGSGVRYRNDGFTDKPTLSDRIFGTKVHPIDNPDCLDHDFQGYVLINGAVLTSVTIDANTSATLKEPVGAVKSRMEEGSVLSGTPGVTVETRSAYANSMELDLRGRKIKASGSIWCGTFGKDLAEKEIGSPLYIMGKVDENKDMEVVLFGDAFVRES